MKLIVEHLKFSYAKKTIFQDLNLQVKEGEFVSLLGPSGCGKSTLLSILVGFHKAENGAIYVEGETVKEMGTYFTYMPQEDLLFPWQTILDNVCLYGAIHHTKKKTKEKALELFPLFGLSGYEQAYPDQLSGGMRQRAAFLRTTLCEADILLLDEPFGALDVIARGEMQQWLLSMREKLKCTTLLVTHDIDEAIYLSDRILILGGNPSTIIKEVQLPEKENRTREWLYNQGALKTEIYRYMMEGKRVHD